MMKLNRAENLADFIAICSEIKVKEDHTLFFRGHASHTFIPLPTVFRHQYDDPENAKYVVREEELFHNLITRCPEEFKNCISTFDCLVKMQHYGLPTRLLDITSNPLVALYFATDQYGSSEEEYRAENASLQSDSEELEGLNDFETMDEGALEVNEVSADYELMPLSEGDARVLIYQVPNDEVKYYNSDTVSIISNLAQMTRSFDLEKSQFKTQLLNTVQAEKPYFKRDIKDRDLETVVCVKPKLDNKRIIKQSGAFFLFGMGADKTTPKRIPEKYRPNVKHIDIPAKAKLQLRQQLEILAISKATLFPEIDSVANFLKSEPLIVTSTKDILDSDTHQEESQVDSLAQFSDAITDKLRGNQMLEEQLRSNTKPQAMQGFFADLMDAALAESIDTHYEMAVKVLSDLELRNKVDHLVYEKLMHILQQVQTT
ncbi:FRG domain-containing protein [Aliivibrio fischeri]|uniref:FRG domain-containing protein n=1 Tax=Aliivibrio fischeri TaxID=668 RepID=A0A6N3Z4A3_ALIFS|nr:FRG domain-containing protein [Aliivibrio fischeri]MUK45410.1 FRG domain-containing protein [Aliivibrio fischeri]MUK82138.1 FRG domain-containing protein [Aliivibrio fischeri]MUK86098.1 FRG domain-containing protein [Aliivibrio fischeri]